MNRFSIIVSIAAIMCVYGANGMQNSLITPSSVKNVRETLASMAIQWSKINSRSIRRESRPLEFNSRAELRASDPSLAELTKFRGKTNYAKIPIQFKSRKHVYEAKQSATEAASSQVGENEEKTLKQIRREKLKKGTNP